MPVGSAPFLPLQQPFLQPSSCVVARCMSRSYGARVGGARVFVVPEKFNRNNPTVRAMGPPAETGLRLLEYVCQRIGIASLAGLDMLDFGCGSRFTDAIVNRSVPLKSYVGIDVYKEMIDFLAEHAKDPRLEFLH